MNFASDELAQHQLAQHQLPQHQLPQHQSVDVVDIFHSPLLWLITREILILISFIFSPIWWIIVWIYRKLRGRKPVSFLGVCKSY